MISLNRKSYSVFSCRAGVSLVAAVAGSLMIAAMPGRASASLIPTVGITSSKLNSTTWQYNLTLGDAASSTTTIGSFWYAWVPGQNYLTSLPGTVTSPAGWTNSLVVNGGGVTDGASIQWTANSSATYVNPGGSLTGFSFQSTDAPSSIFGNSIFHTTPTPIPTSTFVAYSALGEGGSSAQSVATAVPEPVSMAMLTPMALLLLRRRTAK